MNPGPATELIYIVRDTLGIGCNEANDFMGDPRTLGDLHHSTKNDSRRFDFWVRWFEQDPEALARYQRVMHAIRHAFGDLGRLHYAVTGEPVSIPQELVELLLIRVMRAYFPSAGEVVKRARHGSALYAQQCLQRYVTEDAWYERSGA
jgi:hypothetical protein